MEVERPPSPPPSEADVDVALTFDVLYLRPREEQIADIDLDIQAINQRLLQPQTFYGKGDEAVDTRYEDEKVCLSLRTKRESLPEDSVHITLLGKMLGTLKKLKRQKPLEGKKLEKREQELLKALTKLKPR